MEKLKFSPVKGILSSDYKLNLKVNIVGLGEIEKQQNFKPCKPRQTGQNPSKLPNLKGWSKVQLNQLAELDGEIMKWIKKNKTNKGLFFKDPIKAISSASIKMDRKLQKKIARSFRAQAATTQIKEGLNLNKIELSTGKMITTKKFDKK